MRLYLPDGAVTEDGMGERGEGGDEEIEVGTSDDDDEANASERRRMATRTVSSDAQRAHGDGVEG